MKTLKIIMVVLLATILGFNSYAQTPAPELPLLLNRHARDGGFVNWLRQLSGRFLWWRYERRFYLAQRLAGDIPLTRHCPCGNLFVPKLPQQIFCGAGECWEYV